MTPDDSEQTRLLREIAANTKASAEGRPPVRSWAWRLNNLVWLAITLAGVLFGWLLPQAWALFQAWIRTRGVTP